MKAVRKLMTILLCGIVAAGTLAFSACEEKVMNGVYDFMQGGASDYDIAYRFVNTFTSTLASRDKTEIKKLFAPNICANESTFDDDIDDLVEYFQGTYERFEYRGYGTISEGNTKYQNISLDIYTAEVDIYRVAFRNYISADLDGNLGIWSLYMTTLEADPNPYRPYHGDGKWTNGISLEVPFSFIEEGEI